jgi:hypothetical protein
LAKDAAEFVHAPVRERDTGPDHQVLDGPGDKDLGWPGERQDAVDNGQRGPGDLVSRLVDFTGMDPGAHLAAERCGVGEQGMGAPDRVPGPAEGGNDASPSAAVIMRPP